MDSLYSCYPPVVLWIDIRSERVCLLSAGLRLGHAERGKDRADRPELDRRNMNKATVGVTTIVFEGVTTIVFEGVTTIVFEGVTTIVFEGVTTIVCEGDQITNKEQLIQLSTPVTQYAAQSVN